mmetsp:Transcript_94006/g.235976  ORF Transcript_94006/g.235976 Transcript_94006/m.235976 type:complete len:210 (+) Transcript_94006:219-848(+)
MISKSSSVLSMMFMKAAMISSTVPQNKFPSKYNTMIRWPRIFRTSSSSALLYLGECLQSALSTALTTEAFIDKRKKFKATRTNPITEAVFKSAMTAVKTIAQVMLILTRSMLFLLSQRKVRANPKPNCKKQPPRKKQGMKALRGTLDINAASQRQAAVQGAKRVVPPSRLRSNVLGALWKPGCPPRIPTTRFTQPSTMNSASKSQALSW